MKLKLHHINLSTNNVSRMNDFYKNILLLDTETNDLPVLEKKRGYAGDVSFVSDGQIQIHIAEKIGLSHAWEHLQQNESYWLCL